MFDLNSLIRPHIRNIAPYSSARDEYSGTEGVFLDANENPFGSTTGEAFNRYPDPYQHALKVRIGEIKGARPEQIFLGNGSDEAIDLLYRAFCVPEQDEAVLLPPTYGMYQVSADINGIMTRRVELTEDYQLDPESVKKVISGQSKLIFICSPNNPTGNLLDPDAIEQVLRIFPGLVIIDEAYIDFADHPGFVSRLDEFPNLVVLQTFSKAWGMANLRLGMAFASPEIIKVLNKIKPPYNVSGLTQERVLVALQHVEAKDNMVQSLLAERIRMADALGRLPQIKHVYASDANFLLVRVEDPDDFYNYLIGRRVIVRNRSRVVLCEGCLRLSIGSAEENNQLLLAMSEYAVTQTS